MFDRAVGSTRRRGLWVGLLLLGCAEVVRERWQRLAVTQFLVVPSLAWSTLDELR